MRLTRKQIEYIKSRREYYNNLVEDTGRAPPMHLSMEQHVLNAITEVHNAEV